MKKIPCLFVREFAGHNVANITSTVTPGCEWVTRGDGAASRKWDGTACAVIGGSLYKRYDAKRGKDGNYKIPPEHAIPCDGPDVVTGHWPHWVAVSAEDPANKHHVRAWSSTMPRGLSDGTYELVGPPIGGNADGVPALEFKRHGADVLDAPREFDALASYLEAKQIEGIVFAHPDGRMAKIRRVDFGLKWGSR